MYFRHFRCYRLVCNGVSHAYSRARNDKNTTGTFRVMGTSFDDSKTGNGAPGWTAPQSPVQLYPRHHAVCRRDGLAIPAISLYLDRAQCTLVGYFPLSVAEDPRGERCLCSKALCAGVPFPDDVYLIVEVRDAVASVA